MYFCLSEKDGDYISKKVSGRKRGKFTDDINVVRKAFRLQTADKRLITDIVFDVNKPSKFCKTLIIKI